MFSSVNIKILVYILVILYSGNPDHIFAKEGEGTIKKNVYMLSRSMKIGNEPVKDTIFSADDQHAIILSGSSSIEIFRIQTGKRERVIASREHQALSIVLHNAGKLAVTGGKDDTVRIWETDPDFREFCLHSNLPELAANILGCERINLLYDQLFVKEPSTPNTTRWHNDQPYWPIRGRDVVSFCYKNCIMHVARNKTFVEIRRTRD